MMSTENGPKPVQIHRLVMLVFYYFTGCEDFDVNHRNGNKLYNDSYNLEWLTHAENMKHAYKIGLHHKGEESIKTNLKSQTVVAVCERLQENKYTNIEIAEMIGNGVTPNIVSSIKQRESWVDISKDYAFYQRPGKLFSREMIENICIYFSTHYRNNLSIKDHCRNALIYCGYDCSERFVDSVRKIYTRKYYTDISSKYVFD